MRGTPLKPSFFAQNTLFLARALLGKELIFYGQQGPRGGYICEAEAYTQDDPASHAYGGRISQRNQALFKAGGHIYIYLIYGVHYCLNIVSEKEGYGSGVLIRGLKPTQGVELRQVNGPGKLVAALGIPFSLNGASLFDPQCPLKLYEGVIPASSSIQALPRVGISKAKENLWRFVWDGCKKG
jgi:DNA-3-methyladenine glycosylase